MRNTHRLPVRSRTGHPARRRTALLTSAAAVLAAVLGVSAATPASASGLPLPVPYSEVTGLAPSLADTDSAPPGADDWSCRPSAAHPRPVVLVHGTFAGARYSWDSLSPLLRNNGYCVYTFNYGAPSGSAVKGLAPMEDGAATLAAFVDRVLASTGAAKVDLVGHSQGALMPRYYLKYLGGAAKVGTLVGLAGPNHGTSVSGVVTLEQYLGTLGYANDLVGTACDACTQFLTGSAFVSDLNAGGEALPGVRYVDIASTYDELATPYTTAFLTGGDVTDVTLQDGCPIDLSGHVQLLFGRRSLALVQNALDPAHPVSVPCLPVAHTG